MAKKEKKKKVKKIPKSVLDLRKSPKKFAKQHNIRLKGKGMSKREKKHAKKRLEKEYASSALSGLNKAVKILADNPEGGKKINKVRDGVDNIIANPDVMERIAKAYNKNPDQYPHMIYLPAMIMNTIAYYTSESISEEEKEIGKNLNTDALMAFCEKILKKQIKKYKAAGLNQAVAFQMAVAIPTSKLLKNRHWYRRMIQQMYDIAATEAVNVEQVLDAVKKLDKDGITRKELEEGFYSEFILTKNTNKSHLYTDTQKDLTESLVDLALHYLDDLKPRRLHDILKSYIKHRKTAEEYKNDMKRVIKFTDHAHSNSAYTTIKSVVKELIEENPNYELYLG